MLAMLTTLASEAARRRPTRCSPPDRYQRFRNGAAPSRDMLPCTRINLKHFRDVWQFVFARDCATQSSKSSGRCRIDQCNTLLPYPMRLSDHHRAVDERVIQQQLVFETRLSQDGVSACPRLIFAPDPAAVSDQRAVG